MSKKRSLIFILLLIFVVFLFGYLLLSRTGVSCPDKYSFISQDLNCDEDPQNETVALKRLVNSVVEGHVSAKDARRVAVFYRNLSDRQWFGINENENFDPASLLKLPLAMAYYKLQEINPDIMAQEYEYHLQDGVSKAVLSYKPTEELVSGKRYTLSGLIQRMIQYSDNELVPLLFEKLDKDFVNKVYVDMEVYFPKTGGTEQNFVSVKTYAKILRSLYNSSYLNQNSSNELLDIMSKSSFRSGIVSGVSDSVTVSNKFGVRSLLDPVSARVTGIQLHDCGIVYTKDPYILCVMTEGNNPEKLAQVIADISKNIYENR